MVRRLSVVVLLLTCSVAADVDSAEAGRRGWFRRSRSVNSSSYRARNAQATKMTASPRPTKLHLTHSRSAVLDGIASGGTGYDRAWYVGK